ncbi:hypothetical protein LAZ67_2002977 [Cordylochernes scorpioides]|uniref:Endonuclease/exonuclease/phosphatase domain-containing protein n=1 Tax=Cordylochernes scorpioides TaxID=51811 RepID=A0ABY6K5L6_9ARAC|nr:hypothetical protein LAZ67_2002977 [Cordylochernes scorpioides]
MLLLMAGIESNPGPRYTKQTTLELDKDKDIGGLITALSAKMDDWGQKIETRFASVEQGLEKINQRLQQLETSLETTSKVASDNSKRIADLEGRLEHCEMKQRERNLIFYGFEGAENETPDESRSRVLNLISSSMQISEEIWLEQCRILSRKANSPLLVEVPDYKQRIMLLRNAFKLRDKNILLNKDYPATVREQRKILINKRKKLFSKGIVSKLRDNKLIVRGINYYASNGRVVSASGDNMPRHSRRLLGRNTAASRRYRNARAIETPLQSETRRALRRLRYSEARVAATQTMQVPVQRIQLWTHKPFSGLQYNAHIDYKADSSVNIGQMSRIDLLYQHTRLQTFPRVKPGRSRVHPLVENKIQEGFEIVLNGDLNVRTSDLGDFHNLLDTPTLLSASRASSDPASSSLSEILVDFFDDNSLTILNGRSTSDRNGNFTFISSQGSSVIDLAVVSPALLELIVDLSVECMPYSDHLPLVLKLKGLNNMKSKDYTKFCPGTKYSWVADKAISFKGNLRDLAILPLTGSTLNSQVERLTIEIQTAMSRAGMSREIRSGGMRSKPWYDEECYTAKKKMKESLKLYLLQNIVVNKDLFITSKK